MTLVILIIKEGLHAFLLHGGQKGLRCFRVSLEEVVPDRACSGLIDDFEAHGACWQKTQRRQI